MKKINKLLSVASALLIASVIISSQLWWITSFRLLMECTGTVLILLRLVNIVPQKYNSIIGSIGLSLLALFNSYVYLCEYMFGSGALCFLAVLAFLSPYLILLFAQFHQSLQVAKTGFILFLVNGLLCLLFCFSELSIIISPPVLRFAALFLIWWNNMGHYYTHRQSKQPEQTHFSDFNSVEYELTQLKMQYEAGILSEEEYAIAKNKLLEKIL